MSRIGVPQMRQKPQEAPPAQTEWESRGRLGHTRTRLSTGFPAGQPPQNLMEEISLTDLAAWKRTALPERFRSARSGIDPQFL
jgi:hypothetical protein